MDAETPDFGRADDLAGTVRSGLGRLWSDPEGATEHLSSTQVPSGDGKRRKCSP